MDNLVARLRHMNLAPCDDAADKITRLSAENERLRSALKSTGLFLHHCWCDVQMNDHSFQMLNQQMEIVDAALAAGGE